MDTLSITDLLSPNMLKTTTLLLFIAMQKGGRVTIKVENFEAKFAVSSASIDPDEAKKLSMTDLLPVWENPLLGQFRESLVDVMKAGKGEVVFYAGVEKTVNYYPDR